MRVSYQWLTDYVDLATSPEDTAELLTMAGLEVEDVVLSRPSLEGVVVGRIVGIRPHPRAQRLKLCEVDLAGARLVQIVCGAPNVQQGQHVPVATVGTTLQIPNRDAPDSLQAVTIQRAKLVGEVSEGMICAERELGLSDEHGGVMVLGSDAQPGEPVDGYLARTGGFPADAVLDVAVTPNRPDAVSHIGVARDLAALLDLPLAVPRVTPASHGLEAADQVRIAIEAPEACPRYVAMIIRGVRVGGSPHWLRKRLAAIGLRPRNNVVDVTNYVMYECGQPLHAFDFDQIKGAMIRVRPSHPGESFTTLDGKTRSLPPNALMICDADRPVAIAGVMGGENSEVSSDTSAVLIESAYFDPTTIRRAARALGLQTDSSYRFERGVDATGQVWAASRAADLIVELAGGQLVSGIVDENPLPFEPRQVDLRLERVGRILGVDVPGQTVQRLLTAIGFRISDRDGGVLACLIPAHRPDIEREIDVIEEVARLYGFDNIPEPQRTVLPAVVPRERPADAAQRAARLALQGLGYREVVTNSMLRSETAREFLDHEVSWFSGDIVETLNPISQEMSALRPTLLPTVLEVMRHNRNRGRQRLRFFEFGHVFRRLSEGGTIVPGYAERESLLVIGTGPRNEPGLYGGNDSYDYFDVRGVVEAVLERLRLLNVRFEPHREPTTISSIHASVMLNGSRIGTIGRLADREAARYDLDSAVFFAELAWDHLVAASDVHIPVQYERISRSPVVDRDLAFVVARFQEVGDMLTVIEREAGELLSRVIVFDVYEGEGVADNRKSVAFRLRFATNRTLTDEEVDARIGAVVARMSQDFGADLRAR